MLLGGRLQPPVPRGERRKKTNAKDDFLTCLLGWGVCSGPELAHRDWWRDRQEAELRASGAGVPRTVTAKAPADPEGAAESWGRGSHTALQSRLGACSADAERGVAFSGVAGEWQCPRRGGVGAAAVALRKAHCLGCPRAQSSDPWPFANEEPGFFVVVFPLLRCDRLQVRSVPAGTALVALGVGQWLSHAIISGKSGRTAREPLSFPWTSVSPLGKVKQEAGVTDSRRGWVRSVLSQLVWGPTEPPHF